MFEKIHGVTPNSIVVQPALHSGRFSLRTQLTKPNARSWASERTTVAILTRALAAIVACDGSVHVVAFVCSMLKHVAILAVGITRALKHVFGHSGMKQSLTSLLWDQQQRWPILSSCIS